MGIVIGTSTATSTLVATDTYVSLGTTNYSSPDLGYIVILLMVISATLILDLFRRIFTRK